MSLSPWLPFEWVVAFRFLKEGKIQTAFIIAGISIGVAVIVFMSALLTAMQANFVNRVLTGQAHVQLLNHKGVVLPQLTDSGAIELPILQMPMQRFKSIDQWQSVAVAVAKMPEVNVVSPAISGSALLTRGEVSRSVSVVGIIPELYFKIIPLPEKIVQGQALVTSNSILIGTELATDMGVSIGDKVRIATGSGNVNIFNVTGIFDLGNKGANSRNAFVAFRTAQSMFDLVGGVSVLDLTLHDVYTAEIVARQIAHQTGLQADSWIRGSF